MWVKIGDKVYNSEDQPIMVILTERDKENISSMPRDSYKYCEYNTSKYRARNIVNWMNELGD